MKKLCYLPYKRVHFLIYLQRMNSMLSSRVKSIVENLAVYCIVGEAISKYMTLRTKNERSVKENQLVSSLEPFMDQIFEQCLNEGAFQDIIGIALESERLDIVKIVLERAACPPSLLHYVKKVCLASIFNVDFRNQVILAIILLLDSILMSILGALCACGSVSTSCDA
jgi:hypothetical protein